MLEYQIPFFFSAVGVFHGFLTWVYLQFFKRPYTATHTLGCLILLMFCVRVGVSCVYFFTPSLSPYFIQLGLSANFMIGPLLLAYTIRQLQSNNQEVGRTADHHVWINALFITIFGLIYRFDDHFLVWDHTIRYIVHAQLSLYLILTAFQLRHPVIKMLWRRGALRLNELEAVAVYALSLLICLGFVVSLYTNYIIGPVFTSIVFYTLAIAAFAGRKRIQRFLQAATRYHNKKISLNDAKQIIDQLDTLMEKEALYKTPNLKIEQVAARADLSVNMLSQVLNDNLQSNFSSFINSYRIKTAKQFLRSDAYTHLTVEAIGYEVGFNSKSAFYAAFKKLTGLTPVTYRDDKACKS